MKKVSVGMKRAEIAAKLSIHPKRMGAAVYKKGRLISIGWNSDKTHTKSQTWNQLTHAEFSALLGVNKSHLIGSEVYVVRLLKNNRRAISKPCTKCEQLLWAAGVKRAWYTTRSGDIRSMRPRRRDD